MIGFQYARASSVADAVRQMTASRGAKFIAGGTNLVDLMKLDVERPAKLIDVSSCIGCKDNSCCGTPSLLTARRKPVFIRPLPWRTANGPGHSNCGRR